MAQLIPLPLTVSCFSKIQIGVTFLVPAHPGSPGKTHVCETVRQVQEIDEESDDEGSSEEEGEEEEDAEIGMPEGRHTEL